MGPTVESHKHLCKINREHAFNIKQLQLHTPLIGFQSQGISKPIVPFVTKEVSVRWCDFGMSLKCFVKSEIEVPI